LIFSIMSVGLIPDRCSGAKSGFGGFMTRLGQGRDSPIFNNYS
jgi:hypothetical protein